MSTRPNPRTTSRRRKRATPREYRVVVDAIEKERYDLRRLAKAAVALQREKAAKAAAKEEIASTLQELAEPPSDDENNQTAEADDDA